MLLKASQYTVVLACLALAGCASTPPPLGPNDHLHMLNIGRDGALNTEFHPASAIRPVDTDTYLSDLMAAIQGFAASPACRGKTPRLFIHIHGGLNTEAGSLGRVAELREKIDEHNQQGAPGADCLYPVFINWRSGPFTTYWDHVHRIRDGQPSTSTFDRALGSVVYLLGDTLKSVAALPESWYEQSKLAIDAARADYRKLSGFAADGKQPLPQLQAELDAKPSRLAHGAGWLATVWAKPITTPAAYGFGRPAWEQMVRRTRTLFLPPTSTAPSAMAEVSFMRTDAYNGALARFLDRLVQAQKDGQAPLPKITLSGHSMGAIVATEAITLFPDLRIDTLLFMGAAVSGRQAIPALNHYLKTFPCTEFFNLSLHPYRDDSENTGWGLIPDGSLLVWVDSMYNSPVTEFDRTLGHWRNARQFAALFDPDVVKRVHFRVFGLDEDLAPQQHGAFDEARYRFWEPNFWWTQPKSSQGQSPP